MAPQSGLRRWGFTAALVGVSAAAAAARLHELGRRPIWFDEGVTLGMVRLPLGEFLSTAWTPGLGNQVLYYLALRPWHLLGEGEATLRSFSVMASVGAVALVALLGRRLFGSAAGIAAGAVLALHPFAIRYAQEARAYALATLLVCAAALALARAVERGGRRDVAAWVLLSAAATYAHFFAGFVVAAQVLSILALGPRELAARRSLLAGAAAIAAAAVPVAIVLVTAPRGLLAWVGAVDLEQVATVAATLAGGKGFLLVLTALALVLVLAPAIATARTPLRRWALCLVVSWAVFPLAAMAAISIWVPILLERYLSMSIPAWALVTGVVVGPLLQRRRLRGVGAALLAFVLLSQAEVVGFVFRDDFEDWRALAADVARATQPGDRIVYDSIWGGLALGYYLDRLPARPAPLQRGSFLVSGAYDVEEAAAAGRVWVVLSRHDPAFAGGVVRGLATTHQLVHQSDRYGFARVLLYARSGPR